MRLIANLVEDRNYESIDFSKTIYSNPGVGGTTYQQVLLSSILNLNSNFSVLSIHFSANNSLPQPSVRIDNFKELIEIIKKFKVEILVLGYSPDLLKETLDYLKGIRIFLVGHLHLSEEAYKLVSNSSNITVVFPTKQVMMSYFDTPIYNRVTFVPHFLTHTKKEEIHSSETNSSFFDITYIGSITKTKGFHLLAKNWKKISKSIPNARLNVIGSGKLYNPSQQLGKFGIAEEKYESIFIKYLTDKNGNILKNVIFHGTLGPEKDKILNLTRIGVVNPIAQSETFCLSVFDFTILKIPVVTMKRFGLVDTVKDYENGLTYRFKRNLGKTIIKVYRSTKLNESITENSGITFIEKHFPLNYVITSWEALFNGAMPVIDYTKSDFRENYHFIRLTNHYMRKLLKFLPPIVYYEFLYKKIRKISRLVLEKVGLI